MNREILLIIGFIIVVILSGDILFITTKSAFLANWGSIIVPSFFMGILWRLLIKDNLKNNYKFIIPLTLGVVKLGLFVIQVKEATLLAMTFIPIMYSMISYIFLKLGIKVIPSQNKL
jgi:hypothetical protein